MPEGQPKLDLEVPEVNDGLGSSSGEGVEAPACPLDVLPRHRPLSIALCSAGRQRQGSQEPLPVFENLAMLPR
jgi:hypothetical protein